MEAKRSGSQMQNYVVFTHCPVRHTLTQLPTHESVLSKINFKVKLCFRGKYSLGPTGSITSQIFLSHITKVTLDESCHLSEPHL